MDGMYTCMLYVMCKQATLFVRVHDALLAMACHALTSFRLGAAHSISSCFRACPSMFRWALSLCNVVIADTRSYSVQIWEAAHIQMEYGGHIEWFAQACLHFHKCKSTTFSHFGYILDVALPDEVCVADTIVKFCAPTARYTTLT